MIKIGTFLQDRYLIGRQIGAGGMGAVYTAIDQRFESRVAIKETFYNDRSLSEAFEREARLLNNLHHPVLPHVSDFFSENGAHFLVMEFIEGEDLSEVLQSGASLPSADVLRWANQLLDALDFLHSQSPPIIHRDIKPQNLKITTRGDIILLDFGLAKFETNEIQETHSVSGYSKIYSPLEQIEDTGTDARSDIFSLGATGYHLLTGRPPIDALKRAAEIINGNADPLLPPSFYNAEISPALNHILMTALALSPHERYISALAMRTALEYALNETPEQKFKETSNLSTQFLTNENRTFDEELANIEIAGESAYETGKLSIPPAIALLDTGEIDNFENRPNERTELNNSPAKNTVTENYEPFPTAVLDNGTVLTGKRIAAGVMFLLIITVGLIAWNFVGQADSAKKPIPVNVAQNESGVQEPPQTIASESSSIQESESTFTPETNVLPEETNPVVSQEKPIIAVNIKNSSTTGKKVTKPELVSKKTEAKVSEPVVENKTVSKNTSAPKTTTSKPAQSQKLNSTILIIVPSAGVSRPRIILEPKSKGSKPQQSSASEINRFFTGKTSRKQN